MTKSVTAHKHILDNRARTVAEYLRSHLRDASTLRMVSAYFSIYGYGLLADVLEKLPSVRFLFGEPASVGELDPGQQDPKAFGLTEEGLAPTHSLQQKALAQRCKKWIKSNGVAVRSIRSSNLLHGKMYLSEKFAGAATSVVGSSNFTHSGLGGAKHSNWEINLATSDAETYAELRAWFDHVWSDDALTEDVKQLVLAALDRIGQEHAPELIYFKSLYEIFRDEIEVRRERKKQLDESGFYDSEIWHALYNFQQRGAESVINKLLRHNGCILADSVGLGKTYTALAVIKFFEKHNERVLVLCPRKLRENWALYQAQNNQKGNPFDGDQFNYTLLSHTDLSRQAGHAGGVNLGNFNWGNFHLVVIDESHNFRNHEGQRYERLLEEVIKKNVSTKVLMLSATPVNTSLIDLRNQIYLMTGKREEVFHKSLGVSNISNLLGRAQKEFKKWEDLARAGGTQNKADLLDRLGSDFYRLLGGISISRSRRQIKEFYADEVKKIGEFPERAKPENYYPLADAKDAGLYKTMSERIKQFKLSVYRPSRYVVSEQQRLRLYDEKKKLNFNQRDREDFLIAMICINFLKRLESSAHALTLTLERTIHKIDALLEKIDRYETSQPTLELGAETLPDDDEDDEDFLINRARHPYNLKDLDRPRWQEDLREDRNTLTAAYERVKRITPKTDGKLAQLKEQIRQRAQNPTRDRQGQPNRKLLVFTTFKDTAEYLYENLSALARELQLNMAMVAGDVTHTQYGDNNFNNILDNFAPRARGRGEGDTEDDIHLLIATDCISEGQNLQDCDTVLNYDIHWNPVRIIQRFGRIDRIGSQSKAVQMINYWPTKEMDEYLGLQKRVEARMALADAAATGDENPFEERDAFQAELNFRDRQLKQLINEVPDLDELNDGVTLGDFTLDYFFSQLLQYLDKNSDLLNKTPAGTYAVASKTGIDPGVLWVLKHHNAGAGRPEGVASPVHPFYLVHIHENGELRHGCASPRKVLDFFQDMALGKEQPNSLLCDAFNQATKNGRDMTLYDDLLAKAIEHICQAHSDTQLAGLGVDGQQSFKLSKTSEAPQKAEDFELVTWLVIRSQPNNP